MLQSRDLWNTAPPEPRTRLANNPTLLFSWWCTIFSVVIIVTRLIGRKVRTDVLFREDWIMMLAIIPLCIRMGLIHPVLLWGTNNVQTVGYDFTDLQLHHRSMGAKLVLGSRIFYAMYIWMSKLTVSEFLKRITVRTWRRSYEITLQGIRVFLLVTFIAVIVATLAECRPFDHYWQVVPDPGAQCRQGFAQLLTMGTADMITDILLIAFPIPIVLRSGQSWKRKLQLAALFSSSIALIIITGLRMPKVIARHGRQQYRTVWASCEILASTFVSNFVIIGSMLRNKGSKKQRYRRGSVTDSIERSATRRPTMTALEQTGSDEDLFRFLGCRVPDHLQDKSDAVPRPAPAALPAMSSPCTKQEDGIELMEPKTVNDSSDSDDSVRKPPVAEHPPPILSTVGKKNVSFSDIGGLLEDGSPSPTSRSRSTTVLSSGGNSYSIAQDFAPSTPSQSRRASRQIMADGRATPTVSRADTNGVISRRGSLPGQNSNRHRDAPQDVLGPMVEQNETHRTLQDPGGLLVAESGDGRPSQPLHSSSAPDPARHANAERGQPQQDFQDVGGLLQDDHIPDASAAALMQATERTERTHSPVAASRSPGRRREPDEMNLHDAGGSLG